MARRTHRAAPRSQRLRPRASRQRRRHPQAPPRSCRQERRSRVDASRHTRRRLRKDPPRWLPKKSGAVSYEGRHSSVRRPYLQACASVGLRRSLRSEFARQRREGGAEQVAGCKACARSLAGKAARGLVSKHPCCHWPHEPGARCWAACSSAHPHPVSPHILADLCSFAPGSAAHIAAGQVRTSGCCLVSAAGRT